MLATANVGAEGRKNTTEFVTYVTTLIEENGPEDEENETFDSAIEVVSNVGHCIESLVKPQCVEYKHDVELVWDGTHQRGTTLQIAQHSLKKNPWFVQQHNLFDSFYDDTKADIGIKPLIIVHTNLVHQMSNSSNPLSMD